jgi:hypothetical protein
MLICVKSEFNPWLWRACHYSAIFLIQPFFARVHPLLLNKLPTDARNPPKSRAVRFVNLFRRVGKDENGVN